MSYLTKIRANHTVPHICQALKITPSIWRNIRTGRTKITQEQTACIMRAVDTKYAIIHGDTNTPASSRPFASFLEAAAAVVEYETYDKCAKTYRAGRYQIRCVYNK